MRDLINFFVRFHALFLFIILETFCFYLIYLHNEQQRLAILNSANFITGTFMGFENKVHSFFSLPEVHDSLNAEYAKLLAKYNSLTEQDSLTAFYEFEKGDSGKGAPLYKVIPAMVINNSIARANNYITLNKGRLDGMKEDMGVISSNGIVGVIAHVSDHYSTVISILNTRIRISAKMEGSSYFGSLQWNGRDPEIMTLRDIPIHVRVQEGQNVVTTGYSSFFPGNFVIGKVKEYKVESGTGFYDISVKLAADVAGYYDVYGIDYLLKNEKINLENLTRDE